MTADLPQRIPGASHFPHHRTAAPSLALLLRVAQGLDEWAEHDRLDAPPSDHE